MEIKKPARRHIPYALLCLLLFRTPAAAQPSAPTETPRRSAVTYEKRELDGRTTFMQQFSWEADEYALSYELEIQDERSETKSYATERNSLELSLPPGSYRYRIQVYDLLGRPASVTEWQRFEILQAVQPVVTGVAEIPPLMPNKATAELVVSAYGVTPESTISLVSEQTGEAILCSIAAITESEVRVSFSSSAAVPGRYTVRIANPAGLESESEAVSLTAALAPHIRSVVPNEFLLQPDEPLRAAITGSGLTPQTVIELVSADGAVRIPAQLRIAGSNSGNFDTAGGTVGGKSGTGSGRNNTGDSGNKGAPETTAELTVQNGSDAPLAPGIWRLSAVNPGGLADQSEPLTVEETFRPHVVSITPAQSVLIADESVSVTIDGSGFFEKSVFLLVCSDDPADPKREDVLILAPEARTVYADSARLEFPAVPEAYEGGSFVVTVENPANLTDQSAAVSLRFTARPVIVSEPANEYCAVKAQPLLITFSARGVQPDAAVRLIGDDGTELFPETVERPAPKKNGTQPIELTFGADAIQEGTYSIRITNSRSLSAATGSFSIVKTEQPDVIKAETQAKILKQGTAFTVLFEAEGITPKTRFYLIPRAADLSKQKLPRRAIPARETTFDGAAGTAVFSSQQLKETEYALLAENPGSLRDAEGDMTFTLITRIDVAAEAAFGTAIRTYGGAEYAVPAIARAAQISLSCIQTKKDNGYYGAEISIRNQTWAYRQSEYALRNTLTSFGFNLLYQYPLLNEQLRLGAKTGMGVTFINQQNTYRDDSYTEPIPSGLAGFISFTAGVSVTYFPYRHVFFTVGTDFTHVTGTTAFMGFLTPRLAAGVRF